MVIFPADKSNISRLPLGHIIISDMGISCNYLFDETSIFFTAIKNRSLQFSTYSNTWLSKCLRYRSFCLILVSIYLHVLFYFTTSSFNLNLVHICLFKAKESPFFFFRNSKYSSEVWLFPHGKQILFLYVDCSSMFIESNGVCIYLGCQGSSTEFIEEQDIE